jgi:hypothetical protein
LLALEAAAAAATGRAVLGSLPREPVDVIYVDLEMTPGDLRERLTDLGYGPDDDLSRLHYFQLQSLPPLDSEIGGNVLVELAQDLGAEIVVVDTMARAVSGEENSSDTYRHFDRYTGRRLKAAGIAVVRLDHQGKDPNLGQRGSSAKDDDVDLIWRLSVVDGRRVMLKRTHSRVSWVPAEVMLLREEEPRLRHVVIDDTWPAGTADVAALLDEAAVPLGATVNNALTALRNRDGKGRRRAVVMAALKLRRTRS